MYSKITDFTFIGDDKVASYSALDNHLLVANIITGDILLSTKQSIQAPYAVEGITTGQYYLKNRLCVLTLNSELQTYELKAFSEDLSSIETIIEGIPLKSDDDNVWQYLLSENALLRAKKHGDE